MAAPIGITRPAIERSAINDLWARAVDQLSSTDKKAINFDRPDKLNILKELHYEAEQARQTAVKKQWTFRRKNGETVIVRDVFEKVIRWLDTFKQVGDVAVQYDPAHAALPWAAIRLILQIAVNDSNIRTAVVEGLALVAEIICRCAVVENLYLPQQSDAGVELKRALVQLYASILMFLSESTRYAKRITNGKSILGTLAGTTQLDATLGQVRLNEEIVQRCQSLADKADSVRGHTELKALLENIDAPMQRVDQSLRSLQDDLDTRRRIQILQWLSPEPYLQHHKQAIRDTLPGTGQWLLSDVQFKQWKKESASTILWLHGAPGTGKSKIMSIVIKDLIQGFRAGTNTQPIFFYCSRNPAEASRSDPQAILASIARQLSAAELGKSLLDPVIRVFLEEESTGFASGPTWQPDIEESCELIIDLIKFYPMTTIVIDAMDECDSTKRTDFLKTLQTILQKSTSLVKIFISSRDDLDIKLMLEDYPNVVLDHWKNRNDIDQFVEKETDQLIRDGKLFRHSDSKDEMRDVVTSEVKKKAKGMFRWASLQLQYLCTFSVDADIKASLGRLPPGLHASYRQNLTAATERPGEHHALIRKNIFSWLLCAQSYLSTERLLSAASIGIEKGCRVQYCTVGLILDICNNFVVLDTVQNTFRFAHLSVREFLENEPEFSYPSSNALIAEVSLWIMLCGSKSPSTEEVMAHVNWNSQAALGHAEEIAEYCFRFWIGHYKSARKEDFSSAYKIALLFFLFGKSETIFHSKEWMSPVDEILSQVYLNQLMGDISNVDRKGSPPPELAIWEKNARLLRDRLRAERVPGVKIRPIKKRRKWQRFDDATILAPPTGKAGVFLCSANDLIEPLRAVDAKDFVDYGWTNAQGLNILQVAAKNGCCTVLNYFMHQTLATIDFNEDVLVAQAQSESGAEILRLFLDRRSGPMAITEKVIIEASRNKRCGIAILELLLSTGQQLPVTDSVFLAVVQSHGDRSTILEILLRRQRPAFQVTREVVTAALKYTYTHEVMKAMVLNGILKDYGADPATLLLASDPIGNARKTYLTQHRGVVGAGQYGVSSLPRLPLEPWAQETSGPPLQVVTAREILSKNLIRVRYNGSSRWVYLNVKDIGEDEMQRILALDVWEYPRKEKKPAVQAKP